MRDRCGLVHESIRIFMMGELIEDFEISPILQRTHVINCVRKFFIVDGRISKI